MAKELSFTEYLDKIVELLELVQKKTKSEDISEEEKDFFDHADLLIQSYSLLRESIPADLEEEYTFMFKDFLKMSWTYLEEILGYLNASDQYEVKKEAADKISDIDALLKNSSIKSDEINALLDIRLKLMKEKEK